MPAQQIEKVHPLSSPATATPAVDGERVYVYFGSFGIQCFNVGGELLWSRALPMPKMRFGSGTSPVVAGSLVILNRDAGDERYLLALDKRSGEIVWKQEHPPPLRGGSENYATPVIWKQQILIHRRGELSAYDLNEGHRLWWVAATTSGESTPVVTEDAVYVATWVLSGSEDQRFELPDFDTLADQNDRNGDGLLSREEMPEDQAPLARPGVPDVPGARLTLKLAFGRIDSNRDRNVDRSEYEEARAGWRLRRRNHGLIKVKPGGGGDITDTSIAWKQERAVPEVPSPLVYRDRVYMVKNGGIFTCMNSQSGQVMYRARLGAVGMYFSSPVATNGRIYVTSGEGIVTVIAAGDELSILARNDLKARIAATPAIADDTLYVRTESHLYAFGR